MSSSFLFACSPQMTERTGGSDVGNSETVAVQQPDGSYALYGYKFFTSATTSEMSFTLARVVDEKGMSLPSGYLANRLLWSFDVSDHSPLALGNAFSGSKGLSLFYVELPTKQDWS